MTNPGRGGVRAARGLLLALACALLALAGHVAGGGTATSVAPLLLVGGPLAGAFVVWADRQRGFGGLLLAAAGSQLPFHVVFSMCAGAGLPRHSSTVSAAMVAGHLVAAAAMAWTLALGEASLWALYRALRGLAPGLLFLASPVVDVRPLPAGPSAEGPRRLAAAGLVLAAANHRRGPPLLRAASPISAR
jgi:hypothetical protein